jgi:hypothetical protein
MTFTGSLIEDLMATVERAEQRSQLEVRFVSEPGLIETSIVQPWFAADQHNSDHDSKFLGVA